jgi:predicted acyl esterase
MFSKTWKTSERKYDVIVERDVKITMSDGTKIDADIFRPKSKETFPALLGVCPYRKAPQTAPIQPSPISPPTALLPGQEKATGYIEAGDPYFFARRGYVHVVANVRGSGKSEGKYQLWGPREIQDGYETIEWTAGQPWCNGQVGMFGVSYLAISQYFIAALNPPHLKCLFAPWGLTDYYRDSVYHGGILAHGFYRGWVWGSLHNIRPESHSRKMLGDKFEAAIGKLLQDEDIREVQELVQILRNPDFGPNPIVVDLLLNPCDGPFWEERRAKYEKIKVPVYTGADWAMYGMHLPGAFRSWENLHVPKKMIIGPPAYLDRPLYQLQYESIRWFDHWLKGIETGIMDEPPIRLFVVNSNEWKKTNEWPLPETKWTPFYLHERGLLWEHELWPNEGYDTFDDSPWHRGYVEYASPPLVENTEVIGPIVLNLYASTTENDAHFFVSLREVDREGNEKILTRGWLKGSHRAIDPNRSKPWQPYHPHTNSEPLTPGEIYEFNIEIVPTGILFKAGSKIKIRISSVDDPPKHPLEAIATGHIGRQSTSRITVYHDADHPSALVLPVTGGNVVGTFFTGGKPFI